MNKQGPGYVASEMSPWPCWPSTQMNCWLVVAGSGRRTPDFSLVRVEESGAGTAGDQRTVAMSTDSSMRLTRSPSGGLPRIHPAVSDETDQGRGGRSRCASRHLGPTGHHHTPLNPKSPFSDIKSGMTLISCR